MAQSPLILGSEEFGNEALHKIRYGVGNASQAPHERECLFRLSLRSRGAMVEHAKCGRTTTRSGVNYAWIL